MEDSTEWDVREATLYTEKKASGPRKQLGKIVQVEMLLAELGTSAAHPCWDSGE